MAIDLASILKQIARDGSQGASGNSFFYLLDGADIDFKVSGFIVNSGLSGGGSVDNTLANKYIVLDETGLTNAGINSSQRSLGIGNNDIIEKRSTYWGIHSDASLTGGAKGGSGGALAYVVPQQSFYFYDSSTWKKIGSGSVDVQSLTAGVAIGISGGPNGTLYFDNLGVTGIAVGSGSGLSASGTTGTVTLFNMGVTGVRVGESFLTGNVSLTNGTSATVTVAGNTITIGVDTGSLGGNFFVGDGYGNRDQIDLGQSLTFNGSPGIGVSGTNNQLTFLNTGITQANGLTGSIVFREANNTNYTGIENVSVHGVTKSGLVGGTGARWYDDAYLSTGKRTNWIFDSQYNFGNWTAYSSPSNTMPPTVFNLEREDGSTAGWGQYRRSLGVTGGFSLTFGLGSETAGIYQSFPEGSTADGQVFTISAWVVGRSSTTVPVVFSYYDGTNSQYSPVFTAPGNAESPSRLSWTFVYRGGGAVQHVAINTKANLSSSGGFKVYGLQLEHGSVATDYIRSDSTETVATSRIVRLSPTGSHFLGLTDPLSQFASGVSSFGETGDRLVVATGPTNDPFRTYVRFGNAWVQTGVVGIGQGPMGPTGDAGTAGDKGITGTTGSGYTGAYLMPDGTLQVTFADWSSGNLVQTAVNLGTVKGQTGATGATGAAGATGGRGFPFEYLQNDDAPFSGYETDAFGLHLVFKPEFMSAAQLVFVSRIFDEVLERAGGNEARQLINSGISISLFNPLIVAGVETAKFNVSSVRKTWQDYESEAFNAFRFYGSFEIGSTGAIEALNGRKLQVESNILPRKNSKSGFAYRYGLTGTATSTMEPGYNGVNTGWVAPFNNNAVYIAISNEDEDGKSLTGVFANWATIGKGILTIDADEPYQSSQGRIVYDVNSITPTTSQSSFSRFNGTIISGTTGSIPWYQTYPGVLSQPTTYAYRVRVNFIPDGATGVAGVTGATGTVSLTGYTPYSGLTHNSAALESFSGVRGRKYLYMTEDGGITWDYVRPQDIYNSTDFLFDTLTFSASNFPTVRRLSPSNYSLSSTTFSTTYRIGSPANSGGQTAQIDVSASEGSGFPLFSSNADSTQFSAAACSLSGNPDASSSTGRQVVFTLTATGQDFDGDISPSTPKTIAVRLRNDYLYGLTNANFLTGGGGANGIDWVSTRNKNGLSADYGLVSSYPLDETVAGFNKTVTTAETGVNGDYYIYIAYPARLHSEGNLVARLGSSTDPVGGMKLQGAELQDIGTGVSTIQYTNSENFVETYKIWRSEQRFSATAKPTFYISLVTP